MVVGGGGLAALHPGSKTSGARRGLGCKPGGSLWQRDLGGLRSAPGSRCLLPTFQGFVVEGLGSSRL